MISAIYFLRDPETQAIRYVGYSRDPKSRLRTHLSQSGGRSTHKECWIHSLLSKGLKPELEVIEWVEDYQQREIWWIAKLRSEGVDLTNLMEGGGGLYAHSQESIDKMSVSHSGRLASDDTRSKMSLSHRRLSISSEEMSRRAKLRQGGVELLAIA